MMESTKLLISREDSRSMSNDPPQKPPPPPPPMIVERFRTLLKQREEEEEEMAPPSTEEVVVRLYEVVLAELTLNSKAIITDLTIIAGEKREHAEGIADAISTRILETPKDRKLPLLYLLDSIVKNIGGEYIRHFSYRLPEVFCETYGQVHPHLHSSMWRLFCTWSACFPPSVLRKIEMQLEFASSIDRQSSMGASESSRPTLGVHVNPKYLCQVGRSTADSHVRGTSSSVKACGQNPAIGCDEVDPDHSAAASSQAGTQRFNMSRSLVHSSFSVERNKLLSTSTPRGMRSLSDPSRPSLLEGEESAADGLYHQFGTRSTDKLSTEHDRQRTRALIQAYGTENGKQVSVMKPPQVGRLDIDSIGSKATKRSWENTEEEEFDWQDMSSNLAVHGRSREILSSSVSPLVSVRPRSCSTHLGASCIELWNMSDSRPRSSYVLSPTGRGQDFKIPISMSGSENLAPVTHKLQEADEQFARPHSVASRTWSGLDSAAFGSRSIALQPSTGIRPHVNVHGSLLPPMSSVHPLNSNQVQMSLQCQFLPSQEVASMMAPRPPLPQPLILNDGYLRTGQNTALGMPSNPKHGIMPPMPVQFTPNNSFHAGAAALSHLRPGPPPYRTVSASHSTSVSNEQPGSAFSGLVSSLMAQGLISLTKEPHKEDSLGLEFNLDMLKVRHESAIKALYAQLPRQCTTCGLRFKCQEEHSHHMDWHVTKNRMSKTRKQNTSRNWFVGASMWLIGAEALGTDAVPGFLPTETRVEKKDDEELAVPADEDQTMCALCGEAFDDFYSDEAEEWMYRGAVYLNVPGGLATGMDRSPLVPIVHAKCRSEPRVVPHENLGHGEEVDHTEEG